MKKSFWIVLILVILLDVIVTLNRTPKPADQTIKIGFVGPLTGFGAAWGEEQKWAIDTAVAEINSSGGVKGSPIQIIYEDGKCDGKEAVTGAQKLISVDHVSLLFTVCGQESLSVAPIAEGNKVIQIALWSTHPGLSGAGQYVFRNSYSDDDTGRVTAEQIAKSNTKIAVISELAGFSQGLLDAFKRYYKGELSEEIYQPETKDFKALALNSIAKKPQAVLLNPNAPASGLSALKQLRQLGFKGPVFGNYFGGVNEVLQANEAQGMVFFTDPDVPDNSLRHALYTKYAATHKDPKPNFDFAVAVSYDSVYILKQAIESVGRDTSKIKDYLHSLRDFHGIMGTYGFNDKGDAIGYLPSIKQIRGKKIVTYAYVNRDKVSSPSASSAETVRSKEPEPAQTAMPGWKIYSYDSEVTGKVSIRYPESSRADEQSDKYSPQNMNVRFTENWSLMIWPGKSEESTATYIKDYIKQMMDSTTKIAPVGGGQDKRTQSVEDISINGLPAQRFIFYGGYPGIGSTFARVILQDGKTMYMIQGEYPTRNPSMDEKAFKKFYSSFRISR